MSWSQASHEVTIRFAFAMRAREVEHVILSSGNDKHQTMFATTRKLGAAMQARSVSGWDATLGATCSLT